MCCVIVSLSDRISHRDRILARIRGTSTTKSLENQLSNEPKDVGDGKTDSVSKVSDKRVQKPAAPVKESVPESDKARSIAIAAKKQSQRERILQRIRNQPNLVSAASTSAEPTTTTTQIVTSTTEDILSEILLLPVDDSDISNSNEREKPIYERPARVSEVETSTTSFSTSTASTTTKTSRGTRPSRTTTRAATTQPRTIQPRRPNVRRGTFTSQKPTESQKLTTKIITTQKATEAPKTTTKIITTQKTTESPKITKSDLKVTEPIQKPAILPKADKANIKSTPETTSTTQKPVVSSTTLSTTTVYNKPRYLSLPNTNKCQNRKYYSNTKIFMFLVDQ